MLGVAQNPKLWPADHILKDIAKELGHEDTFSASDVGVFFGDPAREGEVVPDPFFGGEGPERTSCIHCGACMVGCRHNAKNTLVKNYLYFAEKWGAKIKPEVIVKDIRPLTDSQPDGARYEVIYSKSTAWIGSRTWKVKARSVIVSAGVLGTLGLLFRCREITRSLPKISSRLGDQVRTNSEAILGATSRDKTIEYSNGLAISSIFAADAVTRIEPVRFPAGSGFIRTLAAPLIEGGGHFFTRMIKSVIEIIKRPIDFVHYKFTADWARRTTVILVMQTEDNLTRIRLGRNLFTGWQRGLVLAQDNNTIPAEIPIGNQVTKEFARRIKGIAASAFTDSLFNFPTTAHILGGVPFGKSASDGVINLDCEVFNYPGLYVIDGSIMPANPGINPSLTITALAEYAMSRIVPKEGHNFGEILVAQPVKTGRR
jgi:cholesterol oxidase